MNCFDKKVLDKMVGQFDIWQAERILALARQEMLEEIENRLKGVQKCYDDPPYDAPLAGWAMLAGNKEELEKLRSFLQEEEKQAGEK